MLASRIMTLACDHNVAHEVSVLYKAMKFSSDTAGIYLQEYVRSLE